MRCSPVKSNNLEALSWFVMILNVHLFYQKKLFLVECNISIIFALNTTYFILVFTQGNLTKFVKAFKN